MSLRRAIEITRNNGVIALVFRVLGMGVYRRLLLLETDLPQHSFSVDPRCRWLRKDEVNDYAACDTNLTPQQIRTRLECGDRCWVLVLENGAIAHGFWVATSAVHVEYLNIELQLAEGEAYLYQSWTPPAHRGRRYASCAANALKAHLVANGVRRTMSFVMPDNRQAYPPVFVNSARPVAYIGWYGIGPWRRRFRTPTRRLPWYAPTPRAGLATHLPEV